MQGAQLKAYFILYLYKHILFWTNLWLSHIALIIKDYIRVPYCSPEYSSATFKMWLIKTKTAQILGLTAFLTRFTTVF